MHFAAPQSPLFQVRCARLLPALAFALLALSAPPARAQAPRPAATPAAVDAWRNQFKAGLKPLGSTPAPVPKKGEISYSIVRAKAPTDEESAAYEKLTAVMEKAIGFYNEHGAGVKKHVTVNYSPGTPTADGSSNGNIRFGKSSQNPRTAMHEIAHTLGVGTSPEWGKLVQNGIFTGANATLRLREITGEKDAQLHADRQHFWPFGLNFDTEVHSEQDLVSHCKIVAAICEDLKAAAR